MKWLLLLVMFRLLHVLAQAAPTVLSTPGLFSTQSEKIRMLDMSIMISSELITVDYLLQNPADQDITTVVSFTTPPVNDKKHYDDFSVFVDGNRKTYERSILQPAANAKSESYFQKVYFWEQDFPSEKLIKISHSYNPRVTEIEFNKIDHEKLWPGFLKTDSPNKDLKSRFVGLLLSLGPKWKRGIEQFNLMVSGGEIILAEVDGEIYGDLGVLKIQHEKLRPTSDILIEFIGDVNQKLQGVSLNLPLIEESPCFAAPNGKVMKTFKKGEVVTISKRQDFWFWLETRGCWIHQSSIKE